MGVCCRSAERSSARSFAVLLVHSGEVLSTDRLIDEVWADEPPSTAAHTVQVYVSNLRKALESDAGRAGADVLARRHRAT